MKYAAIVAALCSVVSGGKCPEGTTIQLYKDSKCTKIDEGMVYKMSAEEAAISDQCVADEEGHNFSVKKSCDAAGYHSTTWYESKKCTGENNSQTFVWDQCTRVSKYGKQWYILTAGDGN